MQAQKVGTVVTAVRRMMLGPRTIVACDAGLLTAAMVAFVAGLTLAAGSVLQASAAGVGAGFVGAIVCGPLAAWHLHARRVDGTSTIGAALGCMVGFLLVWVTLPVAWGLAEVLAGIADLAGSSLAVDDAAGVVGVAAAAVFLAAAVWLDIAAVRDLARTRRRHAWLDAARIGATAAYAAYVVGVIFRVTLKTEDMNAGMVTVLFLVPPVVLGAAAVTGADLMVRRDQKRPRGRLLSGV